MEPIERAGTWRLAGAMVVIELIAGMQVYVSSTVTPLLAGELGGQHLYGLSSAAAQTAMFLSLPLGPAMMRRWSSSRLLSLFTGISVLAACCAAGASSMWAYIAARSVSGLASGALAGVGMGVLAKELTGRARRFTLAANNLMWVASSLAGPTYASWIAAAFSWRVALVAYLPFLVAARLVIIQELRHAAPRDVAAEEQLPWPWAVALAVGMLLLGARAPVDLLGGLGVALGLALIWIAAWQLVPHDVLSCSSAGGPAALGVLGWSAAILFGADAVTTIVAHDQLAMSTHQIGLLLTAGGLTWSLIGLALAAHPASPARFARQGCAAIFVMGCGAGAMSWGARGSLPWFFAGWVMMNAGMGLVYLDAMNLAFDDSLPHALEPGVAGATVAFIEPLAGGITGTLAAGLVSLGAHHGWIPFAALALLALPAARTARRVAAR